MYIQSEGQRYVQETGRKITRSSLLLLLLLSYPEGNLLLPSTTGAAISIYLFSTSNISNIIPRVVHEAATASGETADCVSSAETAESRYGSQEDLA